MARKIIHTSSFHKGPMSFRVTEKPAHSEALATEWLLSRIPCIVACRLCIGSIAPAMQPMLVWA